MKPLSVPGITDSFELVTKYILEVAKAAGLDPKDTYRLRLAVDETVTNIFTHGYAEAGRSGPIIIRPFIQINKLIIQIEDFGISFDPSRDVCAEKGALPPDEHPAVGGFGIQLALSSSDHFHYECLNDFNRSTFVFHIRR